ncbi:hypothetical protein VLK81_08285 [Citroniella saccharovorans]|uniref:Uncharacterized protein n=1 Tax=Citroniella saccharovorans TaxID=2053367 RepID=A0AAW9MQS7_9FIRM|nr:hypothetical protein [Citroniella saccharovorans]MEB3429983.1 hypothetical protein [Citroniella saccharovorans]
MNKKLSYIFISSILLSIILTSVYYSFFYKLPNGDNVNEELNKFNTYTSNNISDEGFSEIKQSENVNTKENFLDLSNLKADFYDIEFIGSGFFSISDNDNLISYETFEDNFIYRAYIDPTYKFFVSNNVKVLFNDKLDSSKIINGYNFVNEPFYNSFIPKDIFSDMARLDFFKNGKLIEEISLSKSDESSIKVFSAKDYDLINVNGVKEIEFTK